jgi:flagellar hook-basal body complex protein FliE
MSMFIVPMNAGIDTSRFDAFLARMEKIRGAGETESVPDEANPGAGSGFREIFEGLINDVEKTEAIAAEDAYKLSIGQLEDPHTAVINAAKAELTLTTMVQIRNKVLDAYSEVMRINI